jgi:hypothetical protein
MTEIKGQATDGYEVYHWPEFRALCRRLGVIWGLPTSALTIQIRIGDPPVILHEYQGRDLNEVPGTMVAVVTATLDDAVPRAESFPRGT